MNATVTLDLREPEVIIRTVLTFDRAVDDFLSDCHQRGFTDRTIRTYQRTYDEFSERLPRDLDVSKITVDDVRRYLATKAHLAPGTVAGLEAHLASLFKSLYLNGLIASNPIDRLPRTRRRRSEDLEVTSVDVADVPRLFAAAQTWSERLALAILVYMGPRRRAVARLRLAATTVCTDAYAFARRAARSSGNPFPTSCARCWRPRSLPVRSTTTWCLRRATCSARVTATTASSGGSSSALLPGQASRRTSTP